MADNIICGEYCSNEYAFAVDISQLLILIFLIQFLFDANAPWSFQLSFDASIELQCDGNCDGKNADGDRDGKLGGYSPSQNIIQFVRKMDDILAAINTTINDSHIPGMTI